jgi:hypothetical protein
MQAHAAVELFAIQKIDDLCEDKAASVHSLLRANTHYFGQRVQMRDTCFCSLAS